MSPLKTFLDDLEFNLFLLFTLLDLLEALLVKHVDHLSHLLLESRVDRKVLIVASGRENLLSRGVESLI